MSAFIGFLRWGYGSPTHLITDTSLSFLRFSSPRLQIAWAPFIDGVEFFFSTVVHFRLIFGLICWLLICLWSASLCMGDVVVGGIHH